MKKKLVVIFSVVVLLCLVIYFVSSGPFKGNKSDVSKKNTETNLQIMGPAITDISLDGNNNSFLSKPGDVVIAGLLSDDTTAKIGEDVSKYIKITPELRGQWYLEECDSFYSRIVFTPQKDWLENKEYKVSIDKSFFKNPKKIKEKTFKFKTQKNMTVIEDFSLWHSEEDLTLFGIKARIKFNFPIQNPNILLKLEGKDVAPKITSDKYNRYYFINYKPITLTHKEQTAKLKVLNQELMLTIPTVDSFFKVENCSLDIIGTGQDAAQVIIFEFSDFVSAQEVEKNVEVYLLPNDKYWENESIDSVRNALKKSAKVEVLALPQDVTGKLVAFKYDKPLNDRDLYIKLKKTLKSKSNCSLNEEKEFVFRIKNFQEELNFIGNGNVLSVYGDKTLTISSRLVGTIEAKISRIFPDRLNLFISQNFYNTDYENANDDNNYYYNSHKRLSDEDIAEIFTKKIKVEKSSKISYSSINLDEYIKNGKLGLFNIRINDYNSGASNERFVLISDIGIIYKKDVDGNIKVFTVSMTAGTPISGAKIELLARNGTVLLTEYTNQNGVCDFADISNFCNEKSPVAFVAYSNDDVSFIPIDQGNRQVSYSKFDTGGKSIRDIRNKELDAYIFTDKGIYKPGETVRFSMILKNEKWTTLLGFPIKIEIEDPQGKIVFTKEIQSNKVGFMESSWTTQANTQTGNYRINLYTNGRYNYFISQEIFKVEEFKEDKLKIKTNIENKKFKGWQLTDEIIGKVKLTNLYGTPAQENEVKAKFSLIPATFHFKEYENYIFSDMFLNKETKIKPIEETLETKKTSSMGEAFYDLPLKDYKSGTYQLIFNAEGFDKEDGSSVNSSLAEFVSPNKYIVGYKTINKLDFIDKDSKVNINIIAINPNLEKVDLNNLKLKFYNLQYVSVPVKEYNGRYRYHSIKQEKEISTKNFSISKKSTNLQIDTSKSGNYKIKIVDKNNNELINLEYVVAGNSNLSYQLEKNSELFINLRNDSIKKGEELEFNVISPYSGIGLITIEKDKIYAYKWFKMDTNSKMCKINIPSEIEDGAYLNVSVLRDKNSKEIFTNSYSYGLKYFKISTHNHELKPNIKVVDLARPGDNLKITYSANKPAKMILYGIDEGVLQVIKYKTPNPLDYFFRKSALDVYSYQTLDLFLPEFSVIKEVYGIGGGADGYEAEMQKLLRSNLNPFKRKISEPIAFWSGIIDVNESTRTYTYKIPNDFNGQIRVMSVVVNNECLGSTEKSVNVRAQIILSAGCPVVVVPTDVFDVALKVENQKDNLKSANLNINVSATKNIEIVGDKTKNINLEYGKDTTLYFKAKALETLGNATISFDIKDNSSNEKSKLSSTLSIRPASTYKTDIVVANDKNKNIKLKNLNNTNCYNEHLNRYIMVSNSPLVAVFGLKDFLTVFPHGCSEQITSQIYPAIVLYGKTQESIKSFENYINKLIVRQRSDGSFSYWEGCDYTCDWVNLYILQCLTDAKELGYNVPRTMFDKLLNWTIDFIKPVNNSTDKDIYEVQNNAKLQAKALYLLARNSKSLSSQLSNLESYFENNIPKWKQTIYGIYIACTYKLLQNEDRANEILKNFVLEKNNYDDGYGYYESYSLRNLNYIYLLGNHFPNLLNNNKNISEIIKSMIDEIKNNRYNTYYCGKAIIALASYVKTNKENDGNIEIVSNDAKLETNKNDLNFVSAKIPLDAKSIEIKSSTVGNLGLFYTFTQQYYDKNPIQKTKNGLEVTRKYFNKDGKEIDKATVGDEITVKIGIKSVDKNLENVVITDLIPGALNIVSGSITGDYDKFDTREDRMIIYTNVLCNDYKQFTYKAKVMASGEFVLPAVEAKSLYDFTKNASSQQSTFKAVLKN